MKVPGELVRFSIGSLMKRHIDELEAKLSGLEEKYWKCQEALYLAYRNGAVIPGIHDLLEPEAYEHDYRSERP